MLLQRLLDLEKVPAARPYSAEAYDLGRFANWLDQLGAPQRGLTFLHIAGTKGKGSTAAIAEAILRAHGFPTAMFTSPHIVHPGERFRLDGVAWSRDQFERELAHFEASLTPAQRAGFEGPVPYRTVFEVMTALALVAFRRHAEALAARGTGLPLVICWETGLGGRLDCTNVVDPAVAVLTTMGLDHTRLLGADVAAITGEKAGILKRGRPVVVARQQPAHADVVAGVVAAAAARVGAGPVIEARAVAPVLESRPLPGGGQHLVQRMPGSDATAEGALSLGGEFQHANVEAALAAADVVARLHGVALRPEMVAAGWGMIDWPGRCELHDTPHACGRALLDGAHCPLSAAALGRVVVGLGWAGGGYRLVWGMQRDKDHVEFLRGLMETAGAPAGVTCYPVPGGRGAPAEELAAVATRLGLAAEIRPSAHAAALAAAARVQPVVAAGTIYTLAQLREALCPRA